MLQVKIMPIKKFMETEKDANTAELRLMYERINEKSKADRLDWAEMPLYRSGDRIFGGGDCVSILSHRAGYGFTIIKVMDRGDWYCGVHANQKTDDEEQIVFYDGEFDEVFEEMVKHFF